MTGTRPLRAAGGGRRGYLALKGPWRLALLLACLSPSPKMVISLKPSHSTKEVLFISRGWFEMSGPVSQRIHATANIFSHHFPIFKFKTQSISPIRKYILYMLNYARYSRYMKQYKMVLTIRELYSAKTFFIRRSVYPISYVNMQPGFYIYSRHR